MKTQTRSYEGAAGGRRLSAASFTQSALGAQLTAYRTLAKRARFLTDNNGPARAGVDAWESALVGSGIVPQSKHPDPEMRKILNSSWERWIDRADADQIQDFYGMQSVVARRLVIDGEIFAAWSYDQDGALQCRLLDAEQCDGSYSLNDPVQRIVAGIQFDGEGRREFYHFSKQRPGLPMPLSGYETVKMPAHAVSHIFRVEAAGQVRGISWFAPVILKLIDLDKASDAQLMRQQTAAMFAGFITDPTGAASSEFDISQNGNQWDVSLEPGMMKFLAPGQDVKFSSPADIGTNGIEFLKFTVREIAAGLSLPYEMLIPDLSDVNYSSIRAGLIEFRRRAEKFQWQIMVRHFCEPAWRRFVAAEILSGRIDAPTFDSDPEDYFAAEWLPPKNSWVDPLKDVQAEILAIDRGLMSRRQAVAARGYNIDNLDIEIAEERKQAAAMGLDFSPPKPEAPAEKKEENNDDEQDTKPKRKNARRRI
jgi:lambda family phage portal protein